MSKGILIFSFDSKTVKYGTIANTCALLVREFLNKPISVVTDTYDGIDTNLFDNVILTSTTSTSEDRWRNTDRDNYYELSPYDETIVIDSDYLVFNDRLNILFNNQSDILLSNRAQKNNFIDVDYNEQRLAPSSLDMIWATCFYFRKSSLSKEFFRLCKYIKENYLLYYSLYKVKDKVFRNDYVFSIARHILSDSGVDVFSYNPFTLYTAYPDVEIYKVTKSGLILYDKRSESKINKLTNISLHILNKKTIIDHYEDFRTIFK